MIRPEYEFLFVDVGMNGRNSDGENWSQSRLKNCLQKNTLNLPNPTSLPGRNYPLPYEAKFKGYYTCCAYTSQLA